MHSDHEDTMLVHMVSLRKVEETMKMEDQKMKHKMVKIDVLCVVHMVFLRKYEDEDIRHKIVKMGNMC